MQKRVKLLKQNMLRAKPNVSADWVVLAKQAYAQYAGESSPVFRAHVFAYVLDHMELSIFPEELIVGSQAAKQRGVSFHPEYMSAEWLMNSLDSIQTRTTDPFELDDETRALLEENLEWWYGKSSEVLLDAFLDDEVQRSRRLGLLTVGNRTMPSCNTMPNHKRLLSEGLNGYILRCREQIAHTTETSKEAQERINFWTASIIACEGVIRFSERYAALAERMASDEPSERRRRELLTIADNCRTVPANAPRTFYQAVQFVWFLQLLVHVEANSAGNGFGRFDQYMYPYYKRDLDRGALTPEEALELIECLYIKTSELLIVRVDEDAKKFAGYPLWQIMMLGGIDTKGRDATNDLTFLCLEGQNELRLTQPALGLRIHDGTPDALFRKGVEMIQTGCGNPAFFNDKTAIPICLQKGGTLEESRDWTVVGCVEPHPGGGGTDASTIGGYINSMKALELVLHNGLDPVSGEMAGIETGDPRSFTQKQDIVDAVIAQLKHMWDTLIRGYNHVVPFHAVQMPVIFASLIMDDCIDRGKCVQEGGAHHNYTGVFFCCPASLADAIEALDYAVFQEKLLTMDEMIRILDSNFAGQERLRQLLITRPAKFGNDRASVDKVCRDIIVACSDYVQQFKDARGGRYCVSNLSQTLNLLLGEYCGATPDGRLAGDPLSDNGSPASGRDICGPTATVKSVGNTDQRRTWDGTLFNLRFDSNGLEGEKGVEIIRGVIQTFFDHYGEHIQINVVNDATLRAAQESPDAYRGLVVRVAGYLAFFTDLDRKVQDNIIARTAHTGE